MGQSDAPKICFLSTRNISHISSLPKYESILQNHYDMIYWNRLGLEERCNAEHIFSFNKTMSDDMSKKEKLKAYLDFRRFALKLLKENRYDKVIVLPTQTAVMFFDYLVFKKRGAYALDIRDYTAENKRIFAWIMKRLVKAAGIVSLTSPAFKEFLPPHDYVISHNWAQIDITQIKQYRDSHREKQHPVKITCVGGIRFIPYFEKVIEAFANDDHFYLGFIGEGAEKLRPFVENKHIHNVFLEGRFPHEDTAYQHSRGDITNNLFGNHTPLLDYALSNRLYFALQYGMPVLACPGTYTAKITVSRGIGFEFDINDPSACDKLWDFYQKLDVDQLYKACDSFMAEVWADEKKFRESMMLFLRGDRTEAQYSEP